MTSGVISAIVPTIGRPESLARLLESLARQSRRPDETIVVDGSADDRIERLIAEGSWQARGLQVRRLALQPPHAVRQRQAAIAVARGTSLLLLDDDVELERDCIQELARVMDEDAGVAAVSADICNAPWSTPTRAWRWYLRYVLGLREGEWQGRVVGPLLRFGYKPLPAGPTPMAWFGTGNTMIRRSAYDASGGFSDFFQLRSTTNEDVDLGLKIGQVGKILICPAARLAHFHAPGGRVSVREAAEDDLYNRYLILQRTLGRSPISAFGQTLLFFTIEGGSNIIGSLERMQIAGLGPRLSGYLRALARILFSEHPAR